uniref:7TM_GPCR_Srx domain-containing protein n=1 Tax=Angiostrongylus cantonensis TaxID=6313 RepID=A0A0K0D9W2_ANGCA
MDEYEYLFHYYFFIFYIFLGSTLLLLNLQMMLVIRRSKLLWIHSAYRLIFFGSAADTVNCGVQVAAVAATLRTPVIHPTTNMLLGAAFQASYAVEYPIMLILSVNRFIAVILPKKMDFVFDYRKTTVR